MRMDITMDKTVSTPPFTAELGTRQRIRDLNDSLRVYGLGGRVLMTNGVAALDDDTRQTVVAAVRTFEAFTEDNDPHGEHDCATIDVDDLTVVFKIDYYNLNLSHHSSNPADPAVTTRVLTVMLAEEY